MSRRFSVFSKWWTLPIAIAAVVVPLAMFVARAAVLPNVLPGGLIKASGASVYYHAADGKRYVFPNEKTYFTWYDDFSGVRAVSDAQLASLPLGGNVTYHPGLRLVKVTTDPKVYAVDRGGTLRWVTTEGVARSLYGPSWGQHVDDLPDAFFVNYRVGDPIRSPADFTPIAVAAATPTIAADLNIDGDRPVIDPICTPGLLARGTPCVVLAPSPGSTATPPAPAPSPAPALAPSPTPSPAPSPAPAPAPAPAPSPAPPVSTSTFQWTQFTPSSDTRVIYLSSATGNDRNDCLSESRPCKTIARGVALLRDGSPDWLLLKRGDAWRETLAGWERSGRSTTEMMLVGSYGSATQRPLLLTGTETGLTPNGPETRKHVAFVGLHLRADAFDHADKDLNGDGLTNWDCLPAGAPNCTVDFKATGVAGVSWKAGAEDILIEDVVVENFGGGVIFDVPEEHTVPMKDIRVRGNVIIDNYAEESNSQGSYFATIDGLLIEGNIIDRNGWSGTKDDLHLLDHNIYIQEGKGGAAGNTRNVVLRNNIIARSNDAGMRSGGIAEDNLFLRLSQNLMFGFANNPVPGGVRGAVRNNVFLEGMDQGGLDRAWGFALENVGDQGVEVSGNIWAHGKMRCLYCRHVLVLSSWFSKESVAGLPNLGIRRLDFHDNITYNWGGEAYLGAHTVPPAGTVKIRNNVFHDATKRPRTGSVGQGALVVMNGIDPRTYVFEKNSYSSTEPDAEWAAVNDRSVSFAEWKSRSGETGSARQVSFPDPNRSIGSYHVTLGGGTNADAFMTEARKQAKGTGVGRLPSGSLGTLPVNPSTWRDAYTASAVNTYIRAGFGR